MNFLSLVFAPHTCLLCDLSVDENFIKTHRMRFYLIAVCIFYLIDPTEEAAHSDVNVAGSTVAANFVRQEGVGRIY